MGMLSVPRSTLRLGVVRHDVQEPALEKVEGAVVGPAEPRLDPRAAGDSPKDAADRALLLPHVADPPRTMLATSGQAPVGRIE
jgi:hypothetical protein